MLYVVPRFGKIYEERSADLPLFSQLLLAWGELVQGTRLWCSARSAPSWRRAVFVLRQTRVRAAIGNALWRLPAIGERLKVYQLARFYRTIGMLLKGGMPLVDRARHGGASCCTRCCASGSPRASRAISEGHAGVGLARRRTASPRRWRCACSRSASAAAAWAR